jgi:hypothetical protein
MIDTQHDFLAWALMENPAAVDFCETLGAISQVWDDVQDFGLRGQPVDLAFWQSLVVLPANPFYREHFNVLHPLVESAILDYITANTLEAQGTVHDRTLSFVLRDSLIAVVIYCARIVGGFAWAAEIAPDVRAYFHNESLAEYLRSLRA